MKQYQTEILKNLKIKKMEKEQLVTIQATIGSLVVPPTKIKRYKMIERRNFNAFLRELEHLRNKVSGNVYRKDCPDCD